MKHCVPGVIDDRNGIIIIYDALICHCVRVKVASLVETFSATVRNIREIGANNKNVKKNVERSRHPSPVT